MAKVGVDELWGRLLFSARHELSVDHRSVVVTNMVNSALDDRQITTGMAAELLQRINTREDWSNV